MSPGRRRRASADASSYCASARYPNAPLAAAHLDRRLKILNGLVEVPDEGQAATGYELDRTDVGDLPGSAADVVTAVGAEPLHQRGHVGVRRPARWRG